MHLNPRLRLLVPVLVVALVGTAYWWQTQQNAAAQGNDLTASGTIEAVQINIAPEVSGRVTGVAVAEGDKVTSGQVLLTLDASLMRAQRAQAEAVAAAAKSGVDVASANLALLEAGPSDPQVTVAESAVKRADLQVDAAQAAYDAIPVEQRSTPQAQTLKQQLDLAEAARDNAQAQLDLLNAGARDEQLAVARAQVAAAQAQADSAATALDVLDVQAKRLALTAPIDGVVLARTLEPGELALPGGTALVLADLQRLEITVFIPEDRYAQIALGQTATLTVDAFPGQTFSATVVRIADKAEFTPRNVQTADGRKTTVYALKLSVQNADGKLKPGMPADVSFK